MKLTKNQLKTFIKEIYTENSDNLRLSIDNAKTGLFNLRRTILKENLNRELAEHSLKIVQEAIQKIKTIEELLEN